MSFYAVNIYLHWSGYRTAIRYIVNGGVLYDMSVGSQPGWLEAGIGPGQFMEGSNSLRFDIVAMNADPQGYATIFADSYIEISDENDTTTQMTAMNTTGSSNPLITTVFSDSNEDFFGGLVVGGLLIGIIGGIGGSIYYLRGHFSERSQ